MIQQFAVHLNFQVFVIRLRTLQLVFGVQRIALQAGEEREVSFAISPAKDLRIYDDALRTYTVDPGAYEVEVGASSADIRLSDRFTVDSP